MPSETTGVAMPVADDAYRDYCLFRMAWTEFGCAPNAMTAVQQQQADERIDKQLLIEHAVLSADERQGVIISQGQVRSGLDEIISRFASAKEFETAMENAGLKESTLKECIHREQLLEAILDRVCADLPAVTQQEAELFYFMHPERFSVGEKREARHILITVNEDFPENTQQQALRRIQEIQKRLLKKKSHRFEDQAQKHSECPTAMHGGLIGHVEKGQLYPELEQQLFQMESGEISDPIESSMGYHLLYCGQIDEARQVPVDEVLPKIRSSLEQRQRNRYQKEWIAERVHEQNPAPKVANG